MSKKFKWIKRHRDWAREHQASSLCLKHANDTDCSQGHDNKSYLRCCWNAGMYQQGQQTKSLRQEVPSCSTTSNNSSWNGGRYMQILWWLSELSFFSSIIVLNSIQLQSYSEWLARKGLESFSPQVQKPEHGQHQSVAGSHALLGERHWCIDVSHDAWTAPWFGMCVVSFQKSGAFDDTWCVSVSTLFQSMMLLA